MCIYCVYSKCRSRKYTYCEDKNKEVGFLKLFLVYWTSVKLFRFRYCLAEVVQFGPGLANKGSCKWKFEVKMDWHSVRRIKMNLSFRTIRCKRFRYRLVHVVWWYGPNILTMILLNLWYMLFERTLDKCTDFFLLHRN